MRQVWNEFEQWLKINRPEVLGTLNEAATESQITEVEQKIGLKFPQNLRELLMIHNGQRDEYIAAIDNYLLLPLDEIVYTWQTLKELLDGGEFEDFEEVEPVGPVKKEFWWNPCWIPVATNGGGDDICIDLDPAEGGKVGQIITFWHDWEQREVISDSLEEWFIDTINHRDE
ncbi:SMI1/KNR4 family protein [Priestia megaterium]|uniref:SMI1/KNR4 family protein n=1 Tax=Priestia megaterium TaxID=1404 RepID=UPI002E1C26BB|nr:SMI1/KNR4 family protein [Priestia megaterium]